METKDPIHRLSTLAGSLLPGAELPVEFRRTSFLPRPESLDGTLWFEKWRKRGVSAFLSQPPAPEPVEGVRLGVGVWAGGRREWAVVVVITDWPSGRWEGGELVSVCRD